MLLTSLNYALSLGFAVTFLLAGLRARRCSTRFATSPASSSRRSPPARRSPAARCRSRWRSPAERERAQCDHAGGRRRVPVTVDVVPDAALPVTLEVPAPRARPRRARTRDVVVGLSARTVAWLGLRPLSARRRRVPGARSRCAAAARGRDGQRCAAAVARRRCRSCGTARIPAGRSAAARRVEGGRARRRLVHQAVRRRRRRRPRRLSRGMRCRLRSMPKRGSRASPPGCSPAERAARPFALTLPGVALPAGQGREHRRAALTALALFPSDVVTMSHRTAGVADAARTRERVALATALSRGADPLARRAAVRGAAAAGAVRADVGRRFRHHAGRAAARCCCAATARGRDAPPARIPSWALGAVRDRRGRRDPRTSFGYLLGRDPCVAFLFVLVGIKYLEARTARDGTLLVCLARFLLVTPFFYSQSLLAALAPLPALLLLGATLRCWRSRRCGDLPLARGRGPLLRTAKLLLQGIPLAACCSCCSRVSPVPLWGLPTDAGAQIGTVRRDGARDRSANCRCPTPSRFASTSTARSRRRAQRYWRGPVMSRFDGREWTSCRSGSDGTLARGHARPRDRLHGDAGAALQAVAVRARPARAACRTSPTDDGERRTRADRAA